MSRDELREAFFQECEDLLEVLDSGLNVIAEGTNDDETVNAVFRAVHSIKGGAGAFALDELVEFAHLFETVLDDVRSEKLDLDRKLIGLFLRSSDVLSDLVAAAQIGDAGDRETIDKIIQELSILVDVTDEEEEEFEPLKLDLDLDLEPISLTSEPTAFEIQAFPSREFYARGNETTLLFRALADLGDIESSSDLSDIPLLDEFDPEDGLCRWTIILRGDVSRADIEDIFEFAAEDCQLSINQILSEHDTDLPALPSLVGEGAAELQSPELATMSEPGNDMVAETDNPDATANRSGAEPDSVPTGQSGPAASAERPDQPRATIRVDLDRVDRLINLVGELVVNQAMIAQTLAEADGSSASEIKDGLNEFRRLTRDIQESVMAIRAQPVKPLFQRMARIVREAAQATDKDVRLVTDGAETEVDKTVVERLADPLTHMIRNAVDHGLENPDMRVQAGKPREGIVRLSAAHRSGRVVIEISDDGAGINRPRVRQIAVEKNLVDEDAVLSDSEIDNLLFLPGFSTAREVSNLSGRGVGMDVVKKSIQSLGGRISIASHPGKGTSLTVSLPLTLAVLDGIVVSIAGETFIVPLSSVIETLKPHPDEAFQIDPVSWALHSRGQVIPVVDVGFELGLRDRVARLSDKVVLVTGTEDGSRNAMIIDAVEDQRQVVIKSLEKNYGEVPGIAAATILGDGRIGLILDVDILVDDVSPTGGARGTRMAMTG